MIERVYVCDYCGRREPIAVEGELPPNWKAHGSGGTEQHGHRRTLHFCDSAHAMGWNEQRAERDRIASMVAQQLG